MHPFDAAKTVELFLELYAVLVNLAYIPFDAISFPPHEIRASDLARFASNMDPVALDLVKNLPYLKGQYGYTIAPGTTSKDLIYHLGYAQNPMDWYEGDNEYIERWSLCLTDGLDGWNSGWLILDTRKGTITKVDWDNENDKPANTPDYYYNYQEAVPIEDVLEPWIKRFVDLEWIPWDGPGEILNAGMALEEERNHYHVLKEMYQTYGWPQNFRADDFKVARDTYIQQINEASWRRDDEINGQRMQHLGEL